MNPAAPFSLPAKSLDPFSFLPSQADIDAACATVELEVTLEAGVFGGPEQGDEDGEGGGTCEAVARRKKDHSRKKRFRQRAFPEAQNFMDPRMWVWMWWDGFRYFFLY